jgi:hypothetical protein
MNAAVYAPVENQCRAAQGTVRDQNLIAAEFVVYEFVPDQDCERVGAGFASMDDTHHEIFVFPAGLQRDVSFRIVKCGNAIACWPTGKDLIQRNA